MKILNLHNKKQKGFTLVELLIAMVVALLVSAAVYASYKVQQQTHKAQMQVTEIQQNLRAAMETMARDFHFAGYDPTRTGDYGVLSGSSSTRFLFTADLCDDGGNPNAATPCAAGGPYAGETFDETYQYELFTPAADIADDDDTTALRRTNTPNPIAENIEFIEFYYILNDGSGTLGPLNAAQLPLVRSVRVTLVGRADEPDYKYTNTQTYPRGSGAGDYDPPDDNYRRRSLIRTIELRNMGI
ncbi:MAG: hypothetical protein Kow0089_17340 [Desulfobulbaceae bacterium]